MLHQNLLGEDTGDGRKKEINVVIFRKSVAGVSAAATLETTIFFASESTIYQAQSS